MMLSGVRIQVLLAPKMSAWGVAEVKSSVPVRSWEVLAHLVNWAVSRRWR